METRIIKFRYRYTDGKNWIMKVFTLEQIVNGEPHEVLSDQPLLKNYKHVGQDQFTGLPDKSGVEIYEGDILGRDGFTSWVVVWRDGGFHIYNHVRPTDLYPINKHECKDYREVIGNLSQHPHLLTV